MMMMLMALLGGRFAGGVLIFFGLDYGSKSSLPFSFNRIIASKWYFSYTTRNSSV